ncbi:aldo/keto reductase, partial [Devosia sp.]|uniref:aldo/keto reductase n=1 Tax=Devosia sp. TaxID=1871048 RepID=UPI001AC3BD46
MGGALIETRPVGTTGIELSRIGFGGAPLGDLRRAPSDAASRELLQAAWDAGIRYFDTAPFYGSGLSERRIGDFLRDRPRDAYVLPTKVGRLLVPDRAWAMQRHGDARALSFRPVFDFTHAGVMKSYEHSLQ